MSHREGHGDEPNVPLRADGHAAAAVGIYPALGDRPWRVDRT